jgi:hypothetical protein
MCNPLSALGVPSGPSGSEQSLAAQESSLSRDLLANYKEEYGAQQQTLGQLTSEINQIRSGTTGPGFGAEENAAYTSQIVNNAAAAERNAQQATQNRAAGVGGGSILGGGGASSLARASGINKQISGEIASAGENAKSTALNQLTAQNYAQGRANAEQTVSGLSRLAGFQDPLAYAREASSTGESAFGNAGQIRKEQDAHDAGIGSLIEGGVSALATGGSSLISHFSPNADTSFLDFLGG